MKKYIPILLILLGCVLIFGFNLGDLSILKGDENYYFSSARRMIEENDFITPRYHHHVRFEKPVLYYWVVALFFKLFGVSWVTARATSVFAGTLTVLLTYLLSLRFFPKKTALLSATILGTSFIFFQYSRLAVIDITFLFLLTLAFFLFIKGDREKKRSFIILCAVPLGLSVLAKGPLGLLIFFITALIYAIKTKKYWLVSWVNLLAGLIIILAISLPWPILMVKIHGQEYLNHLWKIEAVDKIAGSILNLKTIEHPIQFALKYLGYYVPVVLFTFVPWSLFLLFGLFKKMETKDPSDSAFIRIWFWAVFAFFTIVSFKHTHYMLLLAPPLSMIIAYSLSKNIKTVSMLAIVTAMSYIFLIGFIMPNINDNALKNFSLVINTNIKKDERIGIGSRNFNLKKLGMHLNNLVSGPYEPASDDLARYKQVMKEGKLATFLRERSRFFLIITKKDYQRLISYETRQRLYILERNYTWKKVKLRDAASLIKSLDYGALMEEAYLVSNRRK